MKRSYILAILAILVAVALPLIITNAYVIQILFMTALYAYLSSSWNIVGGFAGQLAIGNGLFFGVGLYLTTGLLATYELTPWIGMFIAAFITALMSLILGAATFRLSGSYYGLATVALLNILRIVFNENEYMFGLFFGGSSGVRVKWYGTFEYMQFVEKRTYYYILLAMLIAVLLICNYIRKSRMGYYLLAINTNPQAASSLGVNVMGYKMRAQFLSSFLLALAGGVYGIFVMYMDPQTVFSFQISFNIMLMAVFGGRGTVFGPTIGAIILMPIYELLRLQFSTALPGLPMVIFGLMLMLCMQFMPNGVVAVAANIGAKWKQRRERNELEGAQNG